eukprot:GHUV01037055.1.p2 GENE.GHUV01037055.1~~GHUV01037055.1.p2  ORF type:complete len:104 (-),score=24.87 GHUV01037055.1:42-353(-)
MLCSTRGAYDRTLPLWCIASAGHASAVLVASDAQAAEQAARQAASAKYGLVWTQLSDLATFYLERCVDYSMNTMIATYSPSLVQHVLRWWHCILALTIICPLR